MKGHGNTGTGGRGDTGSRELPSISYERVLAGNGSTVFFLSLYLYQTQGSQIALGSLGNKEMEAVISLLIL